MVWRWSAVAAVPVAQLFHPTQLCHAVDFSAFGREHGAGDAGEVAESFLAVLPDGRTAAQPNQNLNGESIPEVF